MKRLVISMGVSALATPAAAHPDGAPWGSASPVAVENCTSCHFDREAVKASASIMLEGAPEKIEAGAVYAFLLTFANSESAAAGFLAATSDGAFEAEEGVEAKGAEVRSTAPREDGRWLLHWRAPEEPPEKVVFEIAVNAANGDASPFGDVIHFKTIYAAPED